MFKKIISFSLVFIMIFSVFSVGSIYADSLKDVREKIEQKEQQLEKGEAKEEKLQDRIDDLEASIKSTESQLKKINKEIDAIENKIAKLQKKMDQIQTDIDRQQEALNARLRVMYKNGDAGLIQVLLGSVDVSDFMSNLKMVKDIYENDINLLKEIEDKYNEIEKKKVEQDDLNSKLKSHKEEQVSKQKILEADKAEVAKAKAKVEKQNSELHEDLDKLNEEANRLTDEILNLQGGGDYHGSGEFTWPFPGYTRISSEFGYRVHPITGKKKFHSGLDMAGPSGSPIVAAEDGTVISAGWNDGGYGNMVMIDHGGGIVSVYAHNSSLSVSSGQKVKRGQTIAACGSTGLSTGPHLHFEVRVNGTCKNPRNWL